MPEIKVVTEVAGRVCALPVEAGNSIGNGDEIAFVEAMKMENILSASQDVTVAEVLARPGESLSVDQPILRFA